ncbi:MAG: hypothetical protein AAFX99_27120, partial [Myxococcota bacterium]
MTTEITPTQRVRPAAALRPTVDDERPAIKDLTFEGLEQFVRETLGEKRFRAKQIYNWLYARLADDYGQMTNLPKGLRQKLSDTTRLHSLT